MKKSIIISIMSIFVCSLSYAADVKLTWNPNTESDLGGYRIYQSNVSGQYNKVTQKVSDIASLPNVAKIATISVTPEDGRTVYFVATAYDTSGNESGFSNEVSYKVLDKTPPANPDMLSVIQQIANALSSIAENGLTVKIVD